MSTLKVTNIEHGSTTDGGIQLDSSGHVTIDGQQLPTAGALSSRRININGAMQVAQRGTVANAGNEYGGPDRHRFSKNEGAYTISQATDVPAGSGFSNSFKIDVTSAGSDSTAGNYVALEHRIEGQDLQLLKKGTSSAEKLTVQFWIKTPVTGTYVLEFRDTDNTRVICKTYTVSSADTWEKKTLTFDADTTGTLNNDNNQSVSLQWWLLAGSTYSGGTLQTTWAALTNANRAVGQVNAVDSTSNDIYFTGIQVEVGEKATPFEHRSFGDELARCQRYFRRFCEGSSYASAPSSGTGVSSTNAYHNVDLSPEMRAIPTLAAFSNLRNDDITGGQSITSLSLVSNMSSTEAVFLNATSPDSITTYRPYQLLANNTSGAKLDLSAEL